MQAVWTCRLGGVEGRQLLPYFGRVNGDAWELIVATAREVWHVTNPLVSEDSTVLLLEHLALVVVGEYC